MKRAVGVHPTALLRLYALAGWLMAAGLAQAAPTNQGAALFMGQPPLQARLRHQDLSLPPVATRCSNCHRASGANGENGANGSLGPDLHAPFLLRAQARHGGPPSAYDQASFCRVLRTSIAPGEIVIAQAMPQFEISDAQCADLWHYLSQLPGPSHAAP